MAEDTGDGIRSGRLSPESSEPRNENELEPRDEGCADLPGGDRVAVYVLHPRGGLTGQPRPKEVLDVAVLGVEKIDHGDVDAKKVPLVARSQIQERRAPRTLRVLRDQGVGSKMANSQASRERTRRDRGARGNDRFDRPGNPV